MGQGTRLLVDADAISLYCVASGEGIGGVYHGTDTLGLGVGQDMRGTYEVSAGQKGSTTDKPSEQAAFVASCAVEALALTAAAGAAFAG